MPDASDSSNAASVVGQRIRALREERGLSRRRLSERSGMDVSHLARIEQGTGKPTLHTLLQVAASLESTVADLVKDLGRDDLPQSAAWPVTEREIIAVMRRRGVRAGEQPEVL